MKQLNKLFDLVLDLSNSASNEGCDDDLTVVGSAALFSVLQEVTRLKSLSQIPVPVDAICGRLLDSEEHAGDTAIPGVAEDAVEAIHRLSAELAQLEAEKQHLVSERDEALQLIQNTKSSVKHWSCYLSEYETSLTQLTHQFDMDDQRKTNGQVYLDLGAIEGNLDDMMCVTMEVNTDPLNGIDHVPCAHVHFDGDNLAVSLFKIGNKILVRPETGVSIGEFRGKAFGSPETLYWIE